MKPMMKPKMKSNAITNKHHVEDSGAINLRLRKVSRPQTCRFRHRYNRSVWKIITCPDISPFVRWRGKLGICPFLSSQSASRANLFIYLLARNQINKPDNGSK